MIAVLVVVCLGVFNMLYSTRVFSVLSWLLSPCTPLEQYFSVSNNSGSIVSFSNYNRWFPFSSFWQLTVFCNLLNSCIGSFMLAWCFLRTRFSFRLRQFLWHPVVEYRTWHYHCQFGDSRFWWTLECIIINVENPFGRSLKITRLKRAVWCLRCIKGGHFIAFLYFRLVLLCYIWRMARALCCIWIATVGLGSWFRRNFIRNPNEKMSKNSVNSSSKCVKA